MLLDLMEKIESGKAEVQAAAGDYVRAIEAAWQIERSVNCRCRADKVKAELAELEKKTERDSRS